MRNRLSRAFGPDPLQSNPVVAVGTVAMAAILAMLLYKLGNPQHQLKAGIGIAAVIILACAVVRPLFALGVVIAALPFEFFVYGIGTDEALIFAVASLLLPRIDVRRTPTWVWIGGLALVLGSVLSVFTAHNEGQAVWGAVRWLGIWLLMLEAFSLLHDQPQAGRRFVDLVCRAGVVVIFFAFLQKAGIDAIVGPEFQAGNVQSFFNYYTNYGGYAAMITVLATGETLQASLSKERRRMITYGTLTILFAVGTAISASRGALLALAVSWVVLALLNFRRASVFVRLVGILATLILAGFFATPVDTRTRIINRFSQPVGTQTEDIQRFGLQKLGEHALERDPLGIGFNNFRYLSASHPTPAANQIFDHSQFTLVQIGLDAGWLGLAGYVLLVAAAFIIAFFGRRRELRNLVCAAALIGAMAQGLNDYLYFTISMQAFFGALIWGCVWIPDETARSTEAKPASSATESEPAIAATGA